MLSTRSFVLSSLLVTACLFPCGAVAQPSPAVAPSAAEQAAFLEQAEIVSVKSASKGVANTLKARMSDGTRTHAASIQMIDVSAERMETRAGVELQFRDYWGYNVAAYRLSVLLGLDSVPVSVARRYNGRPAAFTWWIDDVIMDEEARVEKHAQPPSGASWRAQRDIVKVFDALIANTDRNQGNILIDARWKVWMIDHTRAFRRHEAPKDLTQVTRCSRDLLAKMKALDFDTLKRDTAAYLSAFEMRALMARRDVLVAHIESLGPNALFDWP